MSNLIEKIKDIILENNYFATDAGQRFKEWNNINDIQAVIAFSGRSKNRESYRISASSDSDSIFVTHLFVDNYGEVWVLLQSEDDDDMINLKTGDCERIEFFGEETLKEWVKLFTY